VESSETLISTLKSVYGEPWGIVLDLVSNLITMDCGDCHDLRHFYLHKIFHEDADLFPYFNFFTRKLQADHPVLYYFYCLKSSEGNNMVMRTHFGTLEVPKLAPL
jgi:hypothetical protein